MKARRSSKNLNYRVPESQSYTEHNPSMSNRQEWAHKCKGKASKNNIITEEDATGMATKTAMAEEVVRVANTKIKTNDMRKKRKVVWT